MTKKEELLSVTKKMNSAYAAKKYKTAYALLNKANSIRKELGEPAVVLKNLQARFEDDIVLVKANKGDRNADDVLERAGYSVYSGWFSDNIDIEKNGEKFRYCHPLWTSKNEVRIKKVK